MQFNAKNQNLIIYDDYIKPQFKKYKDRYILQPNMKFHTVISTVVDSTIQKAWPQVWRKAYQLKDFFPAVTELTIHQKTQQQILRTSAIGQFIMKQRIIKDNSTHTIYFHNISGSHMQGLIYHHLYYNDKKQLILQFGSNAYNLNGVPSPPKEGFGATLDRTKQIIQGLK